VIGTGIIAKDLFYKAKRYERPKTKMRKRDEARRKEVLRTTPRPLEPRLERHLTIGREILVEKEENMEVLSEKREEVEVLKEKKEEQIEIVKGKSEIGRTDDQMESPLFKLPLEIRRQIWEDTLGGYVFHIYFVQAYRRMSHTRCKARSPEPCKGGDLSLSPCRANFKVLGARDQWGHSNLISILQCCRRM
jgi:hypothetical protein